MIDASMLTPRLCKLPYMSTLAERIIEARLEAGITEPAEMARRAGVKPAAAYQWESGATKSLKAETAIALAEVLGVSMSWLTTGKGPKHPKNGVAEPVSTYGETHPQTAVRRVPVRGTASMGMDGYWVDLEYPVGHGDGYFEHPTSDPDAYVLRVKGDSMHPAIRSGWYVLVEPNGTVQQGEYVLVKLNDGRSTVKELLWHKHGEYALLAIANDARLTVAEADVEGIYPIAAVLPPSKRKL